MTELHERLAETLHAAVPEPPNQLDPERIRERSPRHRRTLRRYAPVLAAAAVVVAISIGIASYGVRHGNNPTVAPAGTRLVGVHWQAVSVDGVAPDRSYLFGLQIDATGKFSQSVPWCAGVQGRLSITSTELIVNAVRPIMGLCPMAPTPFDMHAERVVQRLFSGHLAWTFDGTNLTLHKDGGPTIVYAEQPLKRSPKSFTATVTLDRTTVPANGESIRGTLTIDNETGAPVTISDACNGWSAVGLTNDQVRFEAGSGQVACNTDKISVGTTRVPISVRTTYDECSMNPRDPVGPHCLGPEHSVMPNLPVGEYWTKVVFWGLSRDPTVAPPVNVTLTAP